MKPINFVTNPRHDNITLRRLINRLQKQNVQVQESESPVSGHLNIGWGRCFAGEGLNRCIPYDKLEEMKMLTTAGVAVPFETNYQRAVQMFWKNPSTEIVTILGRRKRHARGNDIRPLALNKRTLLGQANASHPNRSFWTLLLPKKREFRLHVFFGQCEIGASKELRPGVSPDTLIWNQENCRFNYSCDIPTEAKEKAIKAIGACHLDFGAVDLIQTVDDKFYVLEVNCRPRLSQEFGTLRYYRDQFIRKAREV